MLSTFETTLQKTNEVLRDIEESLNWPKERRNQSYAALRAVLHALRDRLTVEEAAQFAAQLPMLIRGIYYEGWDPTHVPWRMGREEFMHHVRREFPYDVEGGVEPVVQAVLRAMHRFVTDGEWEDVRATMPKDLAVLVP
jgi:uncharacterized protein (DUF2267 family)